MSAITYQSGVTLRKTSKHDGSNQRFYAYLELYGKARFQRISKAEYHSLNNRAKYKCAFTTNVLKDTVQYTHSIGF